MFKLCLANIRPSSSLAMAHVTIIPLPDPSRLNKDSAWSLPAQTESEIASLAAWCQVKQQQREPLLGTAKGEEEDTSSNEEPVNDDEDEILTNFRASLTIDETEPVKIQFLDLLAEIVCRDKHGSYVTCTSLGESEDSATILIARNAKWTGLDCDFLDSLATTIESIASKGSPSRSAFLFPFSNFEYRNSTIGSRSSSNPAGNIGRVLCCKTSIPFWTAFAVGWKEDRNGRSHPVRSIFSFWYNFPP